MKIKDISYLNFILIGLLFGEIFLFTRGLRFWALIAIIITLTFIFLKKDKSLSYNSVRANKWFKDPEIGQTLEKIDKELLLLKKSGNQLNTPKKFLIKMDSMFAKNEDLIQKYFFIKENYGSQRGEKQLLEIETALNTLLLSLEKINNNFLELYMTTPQNNNLTEELDQILLTLEASIDLKNL